MDILLNRKKAPKSKPFHYIPLPDYQTLYLDNGIPVYILPFGEVEVLEVQAVYTAGDGYETKVGVSDFTPRNMSEGTKNYTSLEFAQALDRYGSWLEYDSGHETISINLITLKHLLPQTLPLLKEVLEEAAFPEDEFVKMKQRTIQKLAVSRQKSGFLAGKAFAEKLYGKNHPYGSTLDVEELEQIERNDLVNFYQNYFFYGNMYLTVCGKFDRKELLSLLNAHFGHQERKGKELPESASKSPLQTAEPGRYHIELEGVQSSLKLGHKGLPIHHPDTAAMGFVNTILGGYFGSRLMHTIREKKGFTYGVYSGWRPHRYAGGFVVQCDVGNEYVEETIQCIKAEIRLLQQEPVKRNELSLVKRYKAGNSISERETPFQLNRMIRFSVSNEISFKTMNDTFHQLQHLDSEKIMELANTYFMPDELIEVVCGQKS